MSRISAHRIAGLALMVSTALAGPLARAIQQQPLGANLAHTTASGYDAFGASHLSEWCALSKKHFLEDLHADTAQDWIVVMGNEAGDLDSMVSAIALAYDVAHTKHKPARAVSLLQVKNDAIDLRPENKLALEKARMERGHKDLLTIEELPFEPAEVGRRIKGIMLVDHNRPLSYWGDTPILGIVDHHSDRGTNTSAVPRVIQPAGSCSSHITSLVLSHKHSHGPVPRSLGDLLLYTIALDTKGLKGSKGLEVDKKAAAAILPHSHYSEEELDETMKDLGKELKRAKNDLGGLTLTQLIQRDWKGDVVYDSTVPIHLGFASIPMSLADMIEKTDNQTVSAFFDVDSAWAHENKVDIAILLTGFKDANGTKQREIILTVRDGHRIDEKEADRLFRDVSRELRESSELSLKPWNGGTNLGRWRAAWSNSREDGGRKVVRPLVEKAVRHW